MGGSPTSLKNLQKKYPNADVVTWHEYQNGQGKNYDIVVGHSQGGHRIQADPTLPSNKIRTEGTLLHFRGRKDSGFFGGHPVE